MTRRHYYVICVILAFLPWVSFNLNKYDTQPWFLLGAMPIVFIALKQRRTSEIAILAFIPLIICILIIDAYSDLSHAIRGLGTYLSLSLSILLFRRYIEVPQATRIKILILLNFVWIAYAMLQIMGLDGHLGLVNSRTSETRGFTSLATEPTFYGIFSLFQMLVINRENKIFKHFKNTNSRWLQILWWLNLFQIVLIARSSMTILLVIVIGVVWLALYNPKLMLILSAIAIVLTTTIIIPAVENSFQSSRPLILATKLLTDPENILLLDRSVNERFSAIYISIGSSISDFFIPHGTLKFDEVSSAYYNDASWIATDFGNKVMSFIGALLFELGFISLLIFVYPYRIIKSIPLWRDAVFWFFTLLVIFLTAVPIGFPLTGYLLVAIEKSHNMDPTQ